MLIERTRIGPGLLFMIMYISMFSYGIIASPYVAAKYMGNNGYFGLILAFLLAIPVIIVINIIGRKFPTLSVIQYLPLIFGNILGKLLGLIYLGFIGTYMLWSTRAIAEEIGTYFVIRTPMWAVVLLFLLVASFIAHQGIEGIVRLASFMFPVTFVLGLAAILFSFQDFELDNIRPVFFVDGFKIPYGTLQMFYPFFPLITLLMIYPYLTDKQKVFKAVTGAAFLAFLLICLIIISGIGNYSAPGILRYNWPVLELIRKTNLPYILQTFGLFFGATWLSQALVGTGYLFYILAQGTSELLTILDYKWMSKILGPIFFIITILPKSVVDINVLAPYLRLTGVALIIGLIFLILLVVLLRKRGEPKNAV